MNQFKVGDTFEKNDIITGGHHTVKIVERKENHIVCDALCHENDGTNELHEEYDVNLNEEGEYIVLWKYKGGSRVLYASYI